MSILTDWKRFREINYNDLTFNKSKVVYFLVYYSLSNINMGSIFRINYFKP